MPICRATVGAENDRESVEDFWWADSSGQVPKAEQRRLPIAKAERPATGSGRLPIIVLQQPAEPLAANDL